MKLGKSLSDLAAEIERRAGSKKDFAVPTLATKMGVTNNGRIDEILKPIPFIEFGDKQFPITSIAHGQIAEHAEIPKKYYDRMLTNDPHLLATNVNAWFGKSGRDEQRLVRTMDGKARAFLSDRYRPLENEELAEVILPVLLDMDLDVMSAEITERRLYIKAVNKTVTRELDAIGGKFGDGKHNIVRCLSPAITISNSEVGMGTTSVLGGVYDGFCSNLATFGERSTRKYHLGGRQMMLGGEDSYKLLSDETRREKNRVILMELRDVVRGAFAEANFAALCDKIAETRNDKIEGDVVKVVELTSKKFGLIEAEGKSVLRQLIEGGDLSRFGLHNAITRAAQDVEDYDRATELERMGGEILELPKTEWKPLAIAA